MRTLTKEDIKDLFFNDFVANTLKEVKHIEKISRIEEKKQDLIVLRDLCKNMKMEKVVKNGKRF